MIFDEKFPDLKVSDADGYKKKTNRKGRSEFDSRWRIKCVVAPVGVRGIALISRLIRHGLAA